jgi:hypothetical protein
VAIREIKSRPIWWQDKAGNTHACEGDDVHRGIFLVWTLCQRDVPANAAFLPATDDRLSCPECLSVLTPTP